VTGLGGRLDRHVIDSRLLRGNPLGDPHERELFVYTPPGYDSSQQRYPLLLALAGYGSTNRSLLNYDFFQPNAVERFDRLIREGKMKPALLALPDAIDRWGGSQFIDSAATGPYQSYLCDEIVPFIDSHYRSVPAREARAVVGRSSGGFGALRIGLERPEVFAAIGSHAGDSAFETSILPELPAAAIAYDRAGGLAAFIARFEQERARVDFTGLMLLAYAAAYAPALEAGMPFCELPVDPRTGELQGDVWRRFMAHDPIELVRRDPDALRTASLVYLDAGDRDEHGLHFGTRRLAELLAPRGVQLHHEEFPGGHRGTAHRYDVSWPLLIDACSRATAG
jgi:enterochelin esterase family protein